MELLLLLYILDSVNTRSKLEDCKACGRSPSFKVLQNSPDFERCRYREISIGLEQ